MSNIIYILTYNFRVVLLTMIFSLSLLYNNHKLAILLIIFVLIDNIIYSLKKLNSRILFLFFQITFFTFLVGRLFFQIFSISFTNQIITDFNLSDNQLLDHVLLTIYLSLISLSIGYRLFRSNSPIQVKNDFIASIYTLNVRRYSLILVYISFVFEFIVLLERVYFKQNTSYLDYYLSFESTLPTLVIRMGSFFSVISIVFLASMPSKKDAKVTLIFILVIGVLSLGYGQRNGFITIILFLISYLFLRNGYKSYGDVWITRKHILFIIAFTPILLSFLVWFSFSRVDSTTELDNIFDGVFYFFDQQGGSARLIAYATQFKSSFPENSFYSFGPAISFVRNSLILDPFDVYENYGDFTTELALNGYSFSSTITYFKDSSRYFGGGGYGSSYVAELVADFGYLGVFFGSFIYGYILSRFNYWVSKNIWIASFALSASISILYAPRAEFLGFMIPLFSNFNITLLIIIHMLSKGIKI